MTDLQKKDFLNFLLFTKKFLHVKQASFVKSMINFERNKQRVDFTHRVDRLSGFFSNRPNRDPSPTPSPAGECVPPSLVPGGGHARLRERGWEGGGGSEF
jgi:hypothetical protein